MMGAKVIQWNRFISGNRLPKIYLRLSPIIIVLRMVATKAMIRIVPIWPKK